MPGRKGLCRFLWIICAALVGFTAAFATGGTLTETAQAATQYDFAYLNTKVQTKSPVKTVITWKKKDVDKYEIYRYNADGSASKKVATLSGKKTSYTIKTKKNKHYSYEIVGRKYKKGTKKLKKLYRGQFWFYSGVAPGGFDEYNYADAYISPKKVELQLGYGEGMKPDGYQIFRKEEGGESYKKIKTLKLSSLKKGSWYDQTVAAGKTYYYKVRTYKKIGGQTSYGPYSDPLRLSAVNKNGKFTVTGKADGAAPVLQIKSAKNNGKLAVDRDGLLAYGYISTKNEQIAYLAREYSLDGINWKKKGKLTIGPGESLWIRFEKTKSKGVDDEEIRPGTMRAYVSYNGIPSRLSLSPYQGTGAASYDEDAIH